MKGTDGKDMNVLNKTPEEIKKANKICAEPDGECHTCPYAKPATVLCAFQKASDTLAYIEQLERERDAAVEQLKYFNCRTCVHSNLMHIASECCGCKNASRWGWRGVKEEKDENG